jgi:hypothetical protein
MGFERMADELAPLNEDELFSRLGEAEVLLMADPARVSSEANSAAAVSAQGLGIDIDVDLIDLGKRFFERVSAELNELVCGTSEKYAKLREQIAEAAALGEKAVIAALTAAIVSGLGLLAALAGLVAAVAVKVFGNAVHSFACDVWKDTLPAD